jgi:heat shock protein HslJ
MNTVCVLSCFFLCLSCSEPKNPVSKPVADEVGDSLKNYDPRVVSRQVSFLKDLAGRWNLVSMRRQQGIPSEILTNTFIEFKDDLTFTGKAPCNGMHGEYELKGTSIHFDEVVVTDMACDNMDPELAFLRLLQASVSRFVINGKKLNLLDVAGNIIFEAQRP